jgi:hypothetical protein
MKTILDVIETIPDVMKTIIDVTETILDAIVCQLEQLCRSFFLIIKSDTKVLI